MRPLPPGEHDQLECLDAIAEHGRAPVRKRREASESVTRIEAAFHRNHDHFSTIIVNGARMPAIFTFPNRIVFGEGSRSTLAGELQRLGGSRPLVVTDRGLVANGLAGEILNGMPEAALFDKVQANPTEEDVIAGLAVYRDRNRDSLIAVGGGSSIDAAKGIRLLVRHPGALADYDYTTGGIDKITLEMPPMIAIPTTSGTGSKAGRGTLIQLAQTGRKTAILSARLLPDTAICDPELTRSLPPVLTAGTGMDAFTHGIESYLSTMFHPICDGIALEGLRDVFKGLEAAVLDGSDKSARRSLMMGALLCGIAFHKGLGIVHALSHALGSSGRVHHGTLNAILLPHALRFNRPAAEPRMASLATQLGLGPRGDSAGHLIALSELVLARLPLPRRLGELAELDRNLIPEYARLALLDHCQRTNPRSCSLADLEDLLDRAW